MAATIASLHLIAVVMIALWSRSRRLTWLGALGVLFVAVAVGNSRYVVLDVISTLIGLGMGLALIGKRAVLPRARDPEPAPAPPPESLERPAASRPVAVKMGLAQNFELHPRPERTGWGWVVIVVVLLVVVGVVFG